jgi:hypothetical protein
VSRREVRISLVDLTNLSNNECTCAFNIQKHVYNYFGIVFPLAMVDDDGEELG